ncbi:hypothetical protein [Vibrio hyugaensis]|uniref:hypothetical protein n=1 Tax=Vibrio hyugaensis TaxID=1534743 RepID=UPI000CE4E518|nr:hypothetical protein [Vibrio hyugaensis]
MSSEDVKKLPTSSGGAYKPIQDLESVSNDRPETTKERALRQKLERQAELKATPEDYARWESNQNRALAENSPSDIYNSVENAAMYVGGITKTLGDAITSDIEAIIADPVSALQSINESLRGVADAVTYFPDALINEVAPEYSYGAQARVNAKINEVIDGAVGDFDQHAALLESGDYLGAGSVAGGYAASVALPGKKVGLPSAKSRYAELKDKYGGLTREEWLGRIDTLSQQNYERRLDEMINSQTHVFRYLSEDSLAASQKFGTVRGYTTTEFSHSTRDVMVGAQIKPEWSEPKYGVAIPTNELKGYKLARPDGDTKQFGWEMFTNSYPEAGSGGWSQFLIDPVPIEKTHIFKLKP